MHSGDLPLIQVFARLLQGFFSLIRWCGIAVCCSWVYRESALQSARKPIAEAAIALVAWCDCSGQNAPIALSLKARSSIIREYRLGPDLIFNFPPKRCSRGAKLGHAHDHSKHVALDQPGIRIMDPENRTEKRGRLRAKSWRHVGTFLRNSRQKLCLNF